MAPHQVDDAHAHRGADVGEEVGGLSGRRRFGDGRKRIVHSAACLESWPSTVKNDADLGCLGSSTRPFGQAREARFLAAHDAALVRAGHGIARDRHGVGRGVDADIEAARRVGAVGRRAVQQLGVHQADAARLAKAGHRLGQRLLLRVGRDAAGEALAVEQRQHRPLVRARHDGEAAVALVDVVEEQQRRHDVGVGVRRVGEVLVIGDLGLGARELQVDLAMVELDVRPDQVGHHVDGARVEHDLAIGVGNVGRVVDAAQRRLLGAVLGAHVEARPAVDGRRPERRGVRAALLDPVGDLGLERGELRRRHGILDHEIAVAPEGVDLLAAENGHLSDLALHERAGVRAPLASLELRPALFHEGRAALDVVLGGEALLHQRRRAARNPACRRGASAPRWCAWRHAW